MTQTTKASKQTNRPLRAQIALARTNQIAKDLSKGSKRISQAEAVRIRKETVELQDKRRAVKSRGVDPLAERVKMGPGLFARRYDCRCKEEAVRSAQYRTAKHAHAETFSVGTPGADSESSSVWASEAGMSKAYCRTTFRVATSDHHFTFQPYWVRDVRGNGLAIVDGMLTLGAVPDPSFQTATPAGATVYSATWVRQGKGTSLVTERGWIVRLRNGSTYHATTARTVRSVLGRQPFETQPHATLSEALERNPIVTLEDCLAAGLCRSGCQDFIERHLGGSDRPVPAKVLRRIALHANDRLDFVSRAIVKAYERNMKVAA